MGWAAAAAVPADKAAGEAETCETLTRGDGGDSSGSSRNRKAAVAAIEFLLVSPQSAAGLPISAVPCHQ